MGIVLVSAWRTGIATALAAAVLIASASLARAASDYTLFGDASLAAGHNSPTGVQLRSVGVTFGGVDFTVEAGVTLADIATLAADYSFTAGSCGGGSPRFQVNVETPTGTKNVMVYIGPYPNYTGCAAGWQTTGNLAAGGNYVDTSQLGGSFYQTFADAKAAYGSYAVSGIQVVADGGWSQGGGTQTVVIDNVVINGTTYTFESTASCKDDGWKTFTSAPGPFKNQGDCVSYFASGGRNTAAP